MTSQVEKDKFLQCFVTQFAQTFRDWEPHPVDPSSDQEVGSNETVIGCSCGHPPEIIPILIHEISLITTTLTESKWLYSMLMIPNYPEICLQSSTRI
jgi:hypothetical protein